MRLGTASEELKQALNDQRNVFWPPYSQSARFLDVCAFLLKINIVLHRWTPQPVYPSRHHIQLHVSLWTSKNMYLEKHVGVIVGVIVIGLPWTTPG